LAEIDRIGLQQRLGKAVLVTRQQVILPQYSQRDWRALLVKVLEKMAATF